MDGYGDWAILLYFPIQELKWYKLTCGHIISSILVNIKRLYDFCVSYNVALGLYDYIGWKSKSYRTPPYNSKRTRLCCAI